MWDRYQNLKCQHKLDKPALNPISAADKKSIATLTLYSIGYF